MFPNCKEADGKGAEAAGAATGRRGVPLPGGDDERLSAHFSDDQLVAALNEVALPYLVDRVGGLDEECDWSDVLSSGEQQRIAFARLFLQKPKLAFLDEATSALDPRNETNLYQLMKELKVSFVSVGHRMSLVPFHTHVLCCDEDSRTWKFLSCEEFERMRNPSMVPVSLN